MISNILGRRDIIRTGIVSEAEPITLAASSSSCIVRSYLCLCRGEEDEKRGSDKVLHGFIAKKYNAD